MAEPHPTHDFPDGAWFCTRCHERKDQAHLRCVVDGPIYEDDPAAALPCDVEEGDG